MLIKDYIFEVDKVVYVKKKTRSIDNTFILEIVFDNSSILSIEMKSAVELDFYFNKLEKLIVKQDV